MTGITYLALQIVFYQEKKNGETAGVPALEIASRGSWMPVIETNGTLNISRR